MGWFRNLRDAHRALEIVEDLRREMTDWNDILQAREERQRKRLRTAGKKQVAEDEPEPETAPPAMPAVNGEPTKDQLRAYARSRGLL